MLTGEGYDGPHSRRSSLGKIFGDLIERVRFAKTLRWRKADSNSRSHFSARATLSLFATSRFEWDLCATYRSEPILLLIPPECARRVVVVTVLRGPHRQISVLSSG